MGKIDLDKIFNDFDFEEEEEVKKEESIELGYKGTTIWGSTGTSGSDRYDSWINKCMSMITTVRSRGHIQYGYVNNYDTHWISPKKLTKEKKNNSKYDKPKPSTNRFNDEERLKTQHYSYKNNYKGK